MVRSPSFPNEFKQTKLLVHWWSTDKIVLMTKKDEDKFEKAGRVAKKIKDKITAENAGRFVGSFVHTNKNKKQPSDMSKEELIDELQKTKFNSLSPKQLIGGCIGMFIYIIIKAIGDYGWHYGDIIGLFLLAFLPGAVFIGGMLENE